MLDRLDTLDRLDPEVPVTYFIWERALPARATATVTKSSQYGPWRRGNEISNGTLRFVPGPESTALLACTGYHPARASTVRCAHYSSTDAGERRSSSDRILMRSVRKSDNAQGLIPI
ncbi:MAG: hypothetical protein CM1200mP36_08460 [Gammaproteobacteria bacterium]|nr:MAG: hypothetical protein CM1200mP36_08460 [Gammaproteobacteria bacterium]